MNFLRPLNNKDESATIVPPKIRFNWYTWLPPILVFCSNLFLVLPFFSQLLTKLDFTVLILLIAYVLGPVCFYFYVWEITSRRSISFIASLIYTLPTSRLSQAIISGDRAHIIALTFVPLVLIFLFRFLRQKTVNLAIILTVGITLIALISPFGLFTLLIFIGTLTYSEMLLGQGRAKLFYTFLVLATSAGLSAFYYHPEFVFKIFQGEQGRALLTTIWNLVPLSFFLVPTIGAFTFLIFDRKPNLQPIFLASGSFFVFFLLVLVGTHISSTYVPIPSRFLPELSLSAAFLSALILVWISNILKTGKILEKLRLPPRLSLNLDQGFLVFVLTFLLASIVFARPHFWALSLETWEASVKFVKNPGGISQVLGGVITVLTILALWFLKKRKIWTT